MSPESDHLHSLLGQDVIVDTAAPFVYLGRLQSIETAFLVLADADVHDLRDSDSTREIYVLRSVRDGIRRNRKSVILRMDAVLSISPLEDAVDH